MNSEDIKLKEKEHSINVINKGEKKESNDDKTTINEETKLSGISTVIHIRQISSLADSIINYLAIGICFFIYGCIGLEWFKVGEEASLKFYLGYFLIGGITLYIIGIINWYEGKGLIFIIDFILSFLFITLFLKNQNLGSISDYLGTYNNDKLQGIFYIMLFCLILVIGVSSKEKGLLYIIDYAVLFITYVFLFAYKFFKNDIIKKIDCYMFIVCGALYWITGILKILNSSLKTNIKILDPSD